MNDWSLLNQIVNLQFKKDIDIKYINLIATRYCKECITACENAGIENEVFISLDLNSTLVFKNALCNCMKKIGYRKIELSRNGKAVYFSK